MTPSMAAKAKPMPEKMTMPPPTEAMSVWNASEEDFEIFPDEGDLNLSAVAPSGVRAEVSQLEDRMLQVETALSQIVSSKLAGLQQTPERQ